MSALADIGIPVALRSEETREHFRLLELPPDLLALLTSPDPPVLHLKSKPDVAHADGDTSKPAGVVLCTADKTYNLRQVSTSNSVYIAKTQTAGLQAIAKCDSAMEILAAPRQSADAYIREMLPVYASTGRFTAQKSVSKQALFADIPLSEDECEEGWAKLMCFESVDPHGCFIPSAPVREKIWADLMTITTAAGVDLTGSLSKQQMLSMLDELRGDEPAELLSAALTSVSDRTADDSFAIDADAYVRTVGTSKLQARAEAGPIDAKTFISSWQDAVPEAWRSKCTLSAIPGAYTLQDGGSSIRAVAPPSSSDKADSAASSAKASLGAKRKWHEKFRASKKS